ncbi:fatty acid cis/trans isomerase, partial [Escherichia coli]|nr:fatty acid cis/trans isomerase [Escherichia coli]
DEESNRDFANDDMTIVRGVVGSYPAAFFSINEKQVKDFVDQFSAIQNESDYVKLLDNFAIRRSSEKFWSFSDRLH